MEFNQVIVEPLITEKTVGQRMKNIYTFRVNQKATKVDVRKAVEKAFKVKVEGVSTCFVRSRRRVTGRSIGKTSSWKKAYVTLVAGQKIQELEA